MTDAIWFHRKKFNDFLITYEGKQKFNKETIRAWTNEVMDALCEKDMNFCYDKANEILNRCHQKEEQTLGILTLCRGMGRITCFMPFFGVYQVF
jgi:hypothetical protein